MKNLTKRLNNFNSTNFRIFYASDYRTHITNFVLQDKQHPLYSIVLRRNNERKKEGIWWHVTTTNDLSKSSVIRSWCRRRLRNAFTDALKTRGFDRFGRLVDAGALKEPFAGLAHVVKDDPHFQLRGSFRFHALTPLIPAKYVNVQRDMMAALDMMLSYYQDEMQVVPPVTKRRNISKGRPAGRPAPSAVPANAWSVWKSPPAP